jgi:uncharacterized protein (TIGR03382 family)
MTFRWLALSFTLLLAAPALAQDGGISTPDASAGMGGAEMNTEEGGETRPNGVCSLSRDCERGFACVNGRCRYVGYRQAEAGCSAVPGVTLAAFALLSIALRRRR